MRAFYIPLLCLALLFTPRLNAQINDSLSAPDSSSVLSPLEQQRKLYEAELLKIDEQKKRDKIGQKEGLPTRFFISFGAGTKTFVGAFDRLSPTFYSKTWFPFIHQQIGFRYAIDPSRRIPSANVVGVFYRYSHLSAFYAQAFMKEQFPGKPIIGAKRSSLDAGVFLLASEKVGFSLSRGWNTLEMPAHPDFVNTYYTLGFLFVTRVWKFETELALNSMFNKHVPHPCLTIDICIRYKLRFWRF